MITLNILAVDDEPGMLSGIDRSLESYRVMVPEVNEEVDFRIKTVETGSAAVDAIKTERPDILLLDYKLPDFNGLEVLKRTDDISEDMLTIMITAYASIETAIAATRQGAYDFLTKPFTPADIKHTVRKAAIRIILARRARRLEAEKKQVRFEFIRVLGHELKAPLSATAGYLYLLRDHTLGNNLEKYDEMVQRSLLRIDQMRKLISDLLDMTRLESGQKSRVLEEVDLVEAARMAIELVSQEADSREITIELNSPDRMTMRADLGEISMIYNNLITNAIKYNRDRGRVDITLSREESGISISVSDTGIGMTEDGVKKLFGEFVRLKDKRTKNILGSGLGLSILKRLVDLYNGRIDVESKLDHGSTFTVYLMELENNLAPDNNGSREEKTNIEPQNIEYRMSK
jgi:two-component system, sensor histidine kinase and response regulator